MTNGCYNTALMLVEVKFWALSPVTAKKPLTRDRKPPVNMRFCVGVFPGKIKVYFKVLKRSFQCRK